MSLGHSYRKRAEAGDITFDEAQEKAAGKLNAFLVRWRKPRKQGVIARLKKAPAHAVRGVYMYGGVGRGKTMLMDMLVTEAASDRVRRVHFHAFMLEVHARLKALRDRGAEDDFILRVARDIAADIDLLCFDELHINDIGDAMIIGPLFAALMDSGVSIVATSNYAPDDLYKNGLQRARFLPFIDLLKANMDVVHLDSPTDYRLRALSEAGTWFKPVNNDTRAAMEALFATLTDHAETPSTTLEIDGRALPIDKADARCAWLTYDTLCKQSRGASDYLALGHAFEAVFVEGVPVMEEDDKNAARRFMTLVDTLYDLGRVLVVQAETAPADLYTGETNAFEFERTVSRLLEVQSSVWLARCAQGRDWL